MAATATLNVALKTALNANIAAATAIVDIDTTAAIPMAAGPTRSIHVPLYRDIALAHTIDTCITITTLLNQWNVYTKDYIAGSGGVLSGYDNAGARKNLSAHLFICIFGTVNDAWQFCTAVVAAAPANAQLNGLIAYFQQMVVDLNAIRVATGGGAIPAPAGAALAAPAMQPNGWSGILNTIAVFNADVDYQAPAGEIYNAPANPATAPVVIAIAAQCILPSYLIRYAFGLLWRIKTVLGDNWPDTHRQMTTGGKKSSRFTHRKKQYSQRRYKK
jgi:hypothetical protein